MTRGNVTVCIWAAVIILLLIGLLYPPIPNRIATDLIASGWLSGGLFTVGVLSAGLFYIGVFSVGVFSLGTCSFGTFVAGVRMVGQFVAQAGGGEVR